MLGRQRKNVSIRIERWERVNNGSIYLSKINLKYNEILTRESVSIRNRKTVLVNRERYNQGGLRKKAIKSLWKRIASKERTLVY